MNEIDVVGLNGLGKFWSRLKCAGKSFESFSTEVIISDSALLQMPPPQVPTKRFVPEIVRALTERSVKPVLTGDQLSPLFVDRKTPPPQVPAKRFAPCKARPRTSVFVKPLLDAAQLAPLLVERKTTP